MGFYVQRPVVSVFGLVYLAARRLVFGPAAAVLAFLWTWNDFIVTLILSTGPETQTLPLGLTKFVREFGVDWGPMTAAGVVMLVPVVVFVFIAERFLVRGLTLGGVKE